MTEKIWNRFVAWILRSRKKECPIVGLSFEDWIEMAHFMPHQVEAFIHMLEFEIQKDTRNVAECYTVMKLEERNLIMGGVDALINLQRRAESWLEQSKKPKQEQKDGSFYEPPVGDEELYR